jgi:hypothetical protein
MFPRMQRRTRIQELEALSTAEPILADSADRSRVLTPLRSGVLCKGAPYSMRQFSR